MLHPALEGTACRCTQHLKALHVGAQHISKHDVRRHFETPTPRVLHFEKGERWHDWWFTRRGAGAVPVLVLVVPVLEVLDDPHVLLKEDGALEHCTHKAQGILVQCLSHAQHKEHDSSPGIQVQCV